MSNVISIYNRSLQTSRDLASGKWPEFLRTAAWNYKYNFPNQVLIFAQRPDATACASLDVWYKKLHRYVNADAAGIALISDAGESMELSYIFDVSDTTSPIGAPIPLWTMTPQKEEDVRIDLANEFLPGSHPYRDDVISPDATRFFYEIAFGICDQMAEPSIRDLLEVKNSCEALKHFGDEELEFEFRTLLHSSITAILMYRCGLEPDIDPAIWESVRNFQDLQAMAILGQTTQSLAFQGLEFARRAVRKWDKEHKEEMKHEQQRIVSEGRPVSNPGSEYPSAEASEPLREDAQEISAGAQTEPLHADDAVRGAGGSPAEYRSGDRADGILADGTSVEAESGSEGPEWPDAVIDSSGGVGLSGDGLRLREEDGELPEASSEGFEVNFPTVQEQAEYISAAVSDLNLTQDEVNFLLGSILKDHDHELSGVFLADPNSEETENALRGAFEPLDETYHISLTDKVAAVTGRSYGIDVARRGQHYIIPWKDVASFYQAYLVENEKNAVSYEAPASSEDLLEGQKITLNGTTYLVTAVSDSQITLQDANYPIFSNTLPRHILDVLLKNNAPEKASAVNKATPTPTPNVPVSVPGEPDQDWAIDVTKQPVTEETSHHDAVQAETVADGTNPVPTEPLSEQPVFSVQEHYIPQILRYDNSAPRTWTDLVSFFEAHSDYDDRLSHLKEHYGEVFTYRYAENEDKKYIGFHGSEDGLEIWEDNYLTTNAKETLSWDAVYQLVEKQISLDRGEELPSVEPIVNVQAVPESDPEERRNFRVSDIDPQYGGPKARFQNNVAAIRLLKSLEERGALATPAEQQVLSAYVGWGGLSAAFDEKNFQWKEEYQLLKSLLTEQEYAAARESTLTAFYTPPAVTEAIFTGLRNLGFESGNILDPCCGTGNFFGMVPQDMASSRLYGVELDSISGRIARQLYQNANIVIDGYEKTALPDSMFDVAVGNVPFGNYQLRDRRYDKEHFLIHDYFFAKTLDKVRPGGIVAFVTSRGTMDKKNDSVRRYIAHRAELLGAIRLPDNTFKSNAGTEAVADILFLKKRERPCVEEPYWVGLDRAYQGGDEKEDVWGPEINAYFVDHPEMVIGDLVEVSGPHGPVLTCRAREGEDLRTALQKAVQNIEGHIGDAYVSLEALDEKEEPYSIPADPGVRNFSYTVVDGDIYFREDSLMFRCNMNKTAEQRVKGMVALRNVTRDLIQAQVDDAPDDQIRDLQTRLNELYDNFSKKYGIINNRANQRAFSDDSSYYLLCSLENLDAEGNFIGKADMFHKRTIGRHKVPDHVETAQEALAVSLGERACVDLGFMSSLSGIPKEKIVSDLKGLIFRVPGPVERYEIASVYLSGNVRDKYREAVAAAKEDESFRVNATYLADAIPPTLDSADIAVRLGSTWVPREDYMDFIAELLNLPSWCSRYMKVAYEPKSGYWGIDGKNMAPYSSLRSMTYGTGRADALDIIEKSLNLQDVQIYDTVEVNGTTRRVLNVEQTLAAQEKQQQIKDTFKEWLWKDPARRDRLTQLYNEKFNSNVPPKFSPDLVSFHGLNPHIELAPHQKESVARILYSGNTLLAHCVGAGKTWTMTAAAMEGKHLGLCNKSLVVVPNHLIGQWAAAIYEAYPQAHVLASTEKDFEPANRKKFCSRIATGDYDIVVIGHSHFEKIPLSAERQEATIQKEIDDIVDAISAMKYSEGEGFSVKKLEQVKKGLQTKLDKLHNSKKRDDVVTFEELGVDRLFVDESHNYKNLFLATKMHNVAGISQTDSQKASDMFLKCRYMDEITGGMGNIHGTGSPLSNTMAELYTTQRYLQYDLLQKMDLGTFDAWASTYGETVVALELAPEGNGYRPRTRFAKFFNLPELMSLYRQVADIRTADMLDLPVPAVEYKTVVLKPSEEQKQIVKSFGERAEKIRKGGVDNRKDNMLCITNEGRKAALDQRLIDPGLPDNPNSKTSVCADRIWDFYNKDPNKKLTQLVFCDISTPKSNEFNVYDDLKEKLIAKGIPADEIRFIHEADTVPQKEALFAKVRSGAVRVLMGSTGKMGTGTNVQDLLIAGHDLDAPWRPSDLEQRAGRVIRRGNENDLVYMIRYVTEGTFDSYMYQLLEVKQRFIDQIMSSENPAREADDIDGAALNYAEIKALSSGDERIKEKVALEMEISRLEVLKDRHIRDKYHMEQQLEKLPVEIQGLKERIAAMKEDLALVSSMPSRTEDGKLYQAVVKGMTFEKQEDAGKALVAAAIRLPNREEWVTIGTLRGFQIQGMAIESDRGNVQVKLAIAGKCRYSIDASDSGQGNMVRLNNVLDSTISSRLADNRKRLASCEADLKSIQEQVNKPFADEALLQEKRSRLMQLDLELNLDSQEKQEAEPSREVEVEVLPAKRSLNEMIAGAASRSTSGPGTSTERESSRF